MKRWRIVDISPRDAYYCDSAQLVGTIVEGDFVPSTWIKGFMKGPMDLDGDERFFAGVKLEEEHEISIVKVREDVKRDPTATQPPEAKP